MNSRLRCRPPKHRLAQRSGRSMRPIGLPSGLKITDAVEPLGAHAPADPQVAVHVDAQAVGRAVRLGGDQRAPLASLLPSSTTS